MESFFWGMLWVGFGGFVIGLYCQYRSRNKFKIHTNRLFGWITALALILMLGAIILLKITS